MRKCLFCRILANELPASFVYKNEIVSAFLDTRPINPGHLLVVPRIHSETFNDLPGEVARHMMDVTQQLVSGLRETDLRCEGVNLFLADGEIAGQEVAELAEFAHVHLHVIPRYTSDGFGLRFAHDYRVLPQREELDEIAAAIRDGMDRV